MSHLLALLKDDVLIAILAHALIGASLVWDKVLLNNPGTKNLFSYVFWLGSMSVFGVILVPFGYNSPSFKVAALAFGAGVSTSSEFSFITKRSNVAKRQRRWLSWAAFRPSQPR